MTSLREGPPAAPLPPSQQRRRAHILACARESLTKHGYDGVTMEDLAARAGVARKTLYNQYGSKDALLLAAVSEIIEGYRSVDLDAEPGIPALLASRRKAVRRIIEMPAYADAMTRAVSQAPRDHFLVDLLFRDGVAFIAEQLRIAADQGELVPGVDIDGAAQQLSAHGWGMSAYAVKNAIALDGLEHNSLEGAVLLLLGITRGARRRWLSRRLGELRGSNTGRSTT